MTPPAARGTDIKGTQARRRVATLGRAYLVGALAALLFLLPPSGAEADTFEVTNTDDGDPAPANSLRAAVENANLAGDAPHLIDATGVSGTINLVAALPTISQDVTIRGSGADRLTVRRNVAADFRIFTVGAVTAEISGMTIANGRVSGAFGGGIHSVGTLTIRDSTVRGNTAVDGACCGGILNLGGALTVENSTITGNEASTFHTGGIGNFTLNATLTVRNSTITGNTAGGSGAGSGGGGGILSSVGAPDVTIENSTIAANEGAPGANFRAAVGTATLRSTILSDPRGEGANCAIEGGAAFTSEGYNLADDDSCALEAVADQPATNPGLGPLASNGGPTETMALQPGSPAIDKGTSDGLTTDQRGHPRPSLFFAIPSAQGGDGSDIGAFERISKQFAFRKVKRDARNGGARLVVRIAGPGRLALKKTGKLRRSIARADSAGRVRLQVRPRGRAKRTLAQAPELGRKVRVTARARVTYRPDGGGPNTKKKKLRLIRKP